MMKMEILEESEILASTTDQTIVVKGKRTKRPRPSSSSSSAAGELHSSPVHSSPTTSSGISIGAVVGEDEDMANCLILLARGNSPPPLENKFSSRRFTEMATTAAGKVGIYVYECKTCSRTFPSFQALGGHRASHKRPKPTVESDQKNPAAPMPEAAAEHGEDEKQFKTSNKNCQINDHQVKPKIHECSICGSEFASGQALGGHMRRHRAALPPIAGTRAAAGGSVDNETSLSHDVIGEKPRSTLGLDFDLNLPAPPEDDDKFHQFSPPPKQRPRMVFSAAAMVDCHY